MILFLIVLLFPLSYAQFIRCFGSPGIRVCRGPKNIGHADIEGCSRNANPEMWYFIDGECKKLRYLGCGGNGNRFCNEFECWYFCGPPKSSNNFQYIDE